MKISEVIRGDYRELEQAYHKILNGSTSDEKVRWRNEFTWKLARHSIGEGLVLYPSFEERPPDGKQMADKDRQEHMNVKQYLNKFQILEPENPEFEPTLQALWKDLSQHIKEEEENDLIVIEEEQLPEESEKMASTLKRTKMFVPSRAHPNVLGKPPFETADGLLAAPIDQLRDIFRKFPKESKCQLPP